MMYDMRRDGDGPPVRTILRRHDCRSSQTEWLIAQWSSIILTAIPAPSDSCCPARISRRGFHAASPTPLRPTTKGNLTHAPALATAPRDHASRFALFADQRHEVAECYVALPSPVVYAPVGPVEQQAYLLYVALVSDFFQPPAWWWDLRCVQLHQAFRDVLPFLLR